mgnify:FL=1
MKKIIMWIICIINLILGIALLGAAQWEIATNSRYSFERPYTQYEIQIILYKWAGILFIVTGIILLVMNIIQHNNPNKYGQSLKTKSFKESNMNIKPQGIKSIFILIILGCLLAIVILFGVYKIIDPGSQGSVRRIGSNKISNIQNNNNIETSSENLNDLAREYTNKSSTKDVAEMEKNNYKTSVKPDYIEYMPIYDEVFNEEKQIYEYNLVGTDKTKIYFYYYKNAKIKNNIASYGMSIWFNKDNQKVDQIQYYLSNDEFDKFIRTYGRYESRNDDTGEMYWNSQSETEISAMHYDDLKEYWPCSTLKISGEGYIVSSTY